MPKVIAPLEWVAMEAAPHVAAELQTVLDCATPPALWISANQVAGKPPL
jgi:hypothetical protein